VKTIQLDKPDQMPEELRSIVAEVAASGVRATSSEALLRNPKTRSIAVQLDAYVRRHRVLAFHCTKEHPVGHLAASGLRVLRGSAHLNDCVEALSPHLSSEQVDRLRRAFERFHDRSLAAREGKLWFCLDRRAVLDRGTEDFFRYFGGESLYRPLNDGAHEDIRRVLAIVGRPVVAECTLSPDELTVFPELAFGRTLLGFALKSGGGLADSLEGYVSVDVGRNQMVAVHEHSAWVRDNSHA
jgi:hypothetical protein